MTLTLLLAYSILNLGLDKRFSPKIVKADFIIQCDMKLKIHYVVIRCQYLCSSIFKILNTSSFAPLVPEKLLLNVDLITE